MGLFSRKAQDYIPTAAEIDHAARAIARDDGGPADKLCDRAGANSQGVAMAILARSVDYTPQQD